MAAVDTTTCINTEKFAPNHHKELETIGINVLNIGAINV